LLSAYRLLTAVGQFAHNVAVKVARFQPDLVVGLAHSGWLPVLAAQAVWEVQQARRKGIKFGPKRKLTAEQVTELKKRREQGELIRVLMKDYRLSKSSVYRYLSG